MMSTFNDIALVILIVVTIYNRYVFPIALSNDSIAGKSLDQTSEILNANKNEDLNSSSNNTIDSKKTRSTNLDSKVLEYALEGGGVPKLTSTSLTKNVSPVSEEESHSKGRKGVAHEGSSIVPRKGVDNLAVHNVNPGTISPLEFSNNNTDKLSPKLNITETKQNSTNQTINYNDVTQQIVHAKKPEVVSDIGDSNDFETYTIIKTSTTGEDYVIIGIVIVIGIWFIVFGALIFYRRAGEYWDRRHYRRMDFLIEGMYND